MKTHFVCLISCSVLLIAALQVSTATAQSADPSVTLKDAFKDDFMIGAAINRTIAAGTSVRANNVNRTQEQVEKDVALTIKQFNQISPENDLKWQLIHPNPGTDGYNWAPADAFVDFGVRHNMYIVGHTLVWHSQTPNWVFQGTAPPSAEGTTPPAASAAAQPEGGTVRRGRRGRGGLTGPRATRVELLQRMRDHIHAVVGRYKGKIKSWDVVNEALADGDGEVVLRESLWRQIIGPDFIAKAFEFAHEADPDCILRYNDYGLENPNKRRKLITLIKQLQEQGVPVHAIGTQAHLNVSTASFENMDQALTEMATLGLPIHVTELDINSAQGGQRNTGADIANNAAATQGGLVSQADQRLADAYLGVFRALVKHKEHVKVVTFWGVNDAVSWRVANRYCLTEVISPSRHSTRCFASPPASNQLDAAGGWQGSKTLTPYQFPAVCAPQPLGTRMVYLLANGDLRQSANQKCWPAQYETECSLAEAVAAHDWRLVRAHSFNAQEGHGFIASQKEGMDVFRGLDRDAPLIVAEAVWQYSHHILHGLISHRGPILSVANWSGTWPGLVGMLNLNGSLTKAGVHYSTLWSEDFAAPRFREQLGQWLASGKLAHDTSHVQPLADVKIGDAEERLGVALAQQLLRDKAILGVFDEGCMGMFNAIIPDHLLNPTGVFKERLSQSALYYETTQIPDHEAQTVRRWLEDAGLKFETGPDHSQHLTDDQIRWQCKMYVAALRIADDFGCDAIGIQYQQGLKDLLPASDLVEGTLNNSDRPPVTSRDGSRILYAGQPLPHFNEVDECAGLDALVTYRTHRAMGQTVETTLHDLRWGDWDASGTVSDYVWVFLISGSAPPAQFIGGWRGATSERQPAMYFPNGGGTLKGISRPGEIVWSRVFIEDQRLKMDVGRAGVVELPLEETKRRWRLTTSQWPIMHAVTYGVSRDQMMGRHKSNHIQVAYANSAAEADAAALAKAAMAQALGMDVAICGTRKGGVPWTERGRGRA